MNAVIRVAYSRGKHGFRARAFVRHDGVTHTRVIGLGDTAGEATQEALTYVRDAHIREGLTPPEEVENVGRIRGDLLDGWLF